MLQEAISAPCIPILYCVVLTRWAFTQKSHEFTLICALSLRIASQISNSRVSKIILWFYFRMPLIGCNAREEFRIFWRLGQNPKGP